MDNKVLFILHSCLPWGVAITQMEKVKSSCVYITSCVK